MARTVQDVNTRFWSKVDVGNPSSCCLWKGAMKDATRGMFSVRKKCYIASRFAWISTNGEIPDGLLVCHICDNGLCCNPSHMFLGTHQDNVTDMINKGRSVTLYGQDDPKSKLTNNQVREIKQKYKPFIYTSYRLAKEYNVSRSTICGIVNGRNWKQILQS